MDDAEIVQLYWDREERAIQETAEKYGNYCHSIIRNILTSQEDIEECVNDTFLNAWNAIPPHRPNTLSTFLGKIARNLALNRYRHNHAMKRGSSQLPAVWDELSDFLSDQSQVENMVDHRELVRAINQFLASLPAKQRALFLCRYWYFDSISELSARLGMTENHVSVTLSRLRARLRSYLLERGFDL